MGIVIKYPKRLIEVDLPIKRISAHARREKSIRHGHICTLHIWWARRPLAACRAVICASLWPDPADELCPDEFRKTARELMTKWAKDHLKLMSEESSKRFIAISKDDSKLDDNIELRKALLDFIADFANWDNSTVPEYLKTSRALTQAAHEALGGERGSRPLVVDPFAGGGSIPLEALRVGADAFASDLNSVAVLLNKVVLEYIPKYGQRLADEISKWGEWIKKEAEKELATFYPKSPDGAIPIAYLWARTIKCEGPGCGADVPLMRSLWLAKKHKNGVALKMNPNLKEKNVDFEIIEQKNDNWVMANANNIAVSKPSFEGTVKRGAATCPCCGYTTANNSVKKQLLNRKGGTADAKLIAIRQNDPKSNSRGYRLPNTGDTQAIQMANEFASMKLHNRLNSLSITPDEPTPTNKSHRAVGSVFIYGMTKWSDLFTPRQLISITTFIRLINGIHSKLSSDKDKDFAEAVQTCLALALDRLVDFNSSLCVLNIIGGRGVVHTFGRQALPMVWDFMETNPFNKVGANWTGSIETFIDTINNESVILNTGHIEKASAVLNPLPDDSAHCFMTDPPYYDSIPYAEIADFFYVWLKRSLSKLHPSFFKETLTSKKDQAIVWHPGSVEEKRNYEQKMYQSMLEGRRVLCPSGIGLVVFAHKSTAGWETQLQAMINAGWSITASWPIDTERAGRLNAQDTASLASSIHLVCRPRENPDGSLRTDDVGDWRDVLAELPKRIHEWMPRLAEEGVVGADAIFACLGPALEIYSRYSSVEKASGEKVELKEYLEQVWAAVSREALKMIFEGADASGFEEDARLTAMWLWTLRTAANGNNKADNEAPAKSLPGYSLEYDAARKIAQGLGAHLENLSHLVEIKGNTAMLLSAGARTRYLFGKDAGETPKGRKKKKSKQLTFDFEGELKQMEEESGDWAGNLSRRVGSTVLDQLHQSMILFGAGRGGALKRFLVDDGIGMHPLYWRLAQSLSALYPSGTDEKRWVDGVLARKKSLGF